MLLHGFYYYTCLGGHGLQTAQSISHEYNTTMTINHTDTPLGPSTRAPLPRHVTSSRIAGSDTRVGPTVMVMIVVMMMVMMMIIMR